MYRPSGDYRGDHLTSPPGTAVSLFAPSSRNAEPMCPMARVRASSGKCDVGTIMGPDSIRGVEVVGNKLLRSSTIGRGTA